MRHLLTRNNLLPSLFLTGTSYYLVAWLALQFTTTPSGLVALWPANAVLTLILLLEPRRHWGWHVVAAFCAECLASFTLLPLWSLAGIATLHSGGCVVAALIIQRLDRRNTMLPPTEVNALGVLFLLITLILPAATALLGSLLYVSSNTSLDYIPTWRSWWVGEAAGFAIFLPLLLLIFSRSQHHASPAQAKLGPGQWLLLIIVGAAVVLLLLTTQEMAPYLACAWTLWLAIRFTPFITAVTVTLVALAGVAGAVPHAEDIAIMLAVASGLLSLAMQQTRVIQFQLKMEAERRKISQHSLNKAYQHLEQLNQQLDAKAMARNKKLETLNMELQRSVIELKGQYSALQKRHSDLVADMATKSLQQAEIAQAHTRLSREVQFYHEEIKVLRQQIDFFISIANTSEISY